MLVVMVLAVVLVELVGALITYLQYKFMISHFTFIAFVSFSRLSLIFIKSNRPQIVFNKVMQSFKPILTKQPLQLLQPIQPLQPTSITQSNQAHHLSADRY